MRKPAGLGLARGGSPRMKPPMEEEMEYGGEADLGGEEGYNPAPRKPSYPDEGGEDFDPTDDMQKPSQYDGYSKAAARDAEMIRDEVPDDQAGAAMMEWRRRWMERAKQAGLSERQASQALDDIQDGL